MAVCVCTVLVMLVREQANSVLHKYHMPNTKSLNESHMLTDPTGLHEGTYCRHLAFVVSIGVYSENSDKVR